MVMDEKVKESFVLDTASAICNYDTHYKDHPKYWCRGYFRDYCNIIAFTPNSTDRVALRAPGESGLVSRGSQGLCSPLESRRGSLGAP